MAFRSVRPQLVIDVRMFGLKHAGIGRYVQELIRHLPKYAKDIKTTLICHPNDSNALNSLIPSGWRTHSISAPHYSLAEQYHLAQILYHLRPALVHFPHFNYPVSYRGKFVVTIHDILWHKQKGTQVTTLPPWYYWPKYIAYRFVIKQAITQAVSIITPSQFVKNDLIHTFKLDKHKIIPIHEGVFPAYFKQFPAVSRLPHQPYLIYTGSFYPHKNINRLIRAIKILNQTNNSVHLYLVGAQSVFQQKTADFINQIQAGKWVTFTGFISDKKLVQYYQHAAAFVFPSLSEGFGLPGLEALACGCPVIAADSSSLPEIYGPHACYFDPTSTKSLLTAISQTLSHPPSTSVRLRYRTYASQFDWDATARLTAKIYHQHLA